MRNTDIQQEIDNLKLAVKSLEDRFHSQCKAIDEVHVGQVYSLCGELYLVAAVAGGMLGLTGLGGLYTGCYSSRFEPNPIESGNLSKVKKY